MVKTAGVSLSPTGPKVAAIGGGHGLSKSLLAARRYASRLSAIVSVADDGGSSGRLREQLGIPAPGDVRRCLSAMSARPSLLAQTLEHRFGSGELAGHAFGNLLIAALAVTAGGFVEGVEELCRLLPTVGEVLPATAGPVMLAAAGPEGTTRGQVAIMQSGGILNLTLEPRGARPPQAVLDAIGTADQVVIGPGSLYTSVLAACIVPDVRRALEATSAQRVYVANLRDQPPETRGYGLVDHLAALERHGIGIDVVLADHRAQCSAGEQLDLARKLAETGGARLVTAEVADDRLV
ncbi:MAG: gluconeogenesis factor YvcK family protein, partial [Acidimicrobiales bacterium]